MTFAGLPFRVSVGVGESVASVSSIFWVIELANAKKVGYDEWSFRT